MPKYDNIEYTFKIIRELPLSVSFEQVEQWVLTYDASTSVKPKTTLMSKFKNWSANFYERMTFFRRGK